MDVPPAYLDGLGDGLGAVLPGLDEPRGDLLLSSLCHLLSFSISSLVSEVCRRSFSVPFCTLSMGSTTSFAPIPRNPPTSSVTALMSLELSARTLFTPPIFLPSE